MLLNVLLLLLRLVLYYNTKLFSSQHNSRHGGARCLRSSNAQWPGTARISRRPRQHK